MVGYSLYRSTASRPLHADDLEDILNASRRNNRARDLTGCLHYESGLFFQWLEGPEEALDPAILSILEDDRHRDVVVLAQGTSDQRQFQNWQMRFSDDNDASLLEWLASAQVSTLDREHYGEAVMAFLQSLRT